MLLEGIDPLEAKIAKLQAERRERQKSLPFRDCANQYIEAHRKSSKNEKHVAQWGSTIETYANPVIGHLSVAQIETDEILRVLEAIWTDKTETATRQQEGASARALQLVKPLIDFGTSEVLSPASKGNGHLSNMAMLQLLKRMKREDLTVHDFRSTFKNWARETTDYAREVSEAALAHIIGDQTEAAYARGDLITKRARLMQDWADYLASMSSESHCETQGVVG